MSVLRRLEDLGALVCYTLNGNTDDAMGNHTDAGSATEQDITYVNDSPFSDLNQSASFNGSSSRITMPSYAALDNILGNYNSTNYITVGCWYKATGTIANNQQMAVFNKHDPANSDNGWEFQIREMQNRSRDDRLGLRTIGWGPSTNSIIETTTTGSSFPLYTDGEWHFFSRSWRLNSGVGPAGFVDGDTLWNNVYSNITGGDVLTDAGVGLVIGARPGSPDSTHVQGYLSCPFIIVNSNLAVARGLQKMLAMETTFGPNGYEETYHIDQSTRTVGDLGSAYYLVGDHTTPVGTQNHIGSFCNWTPDLSLPNYLESEADELIENTTPSSITHETTNTPNANAGWTGFDNFNGCATFAGDLASTNLLSPSNSGNDPSYYAQSNTAYVTMEFVFRPTSVDTYHRTLFSKGRWYGTNLRELAVYIDKDTSKLTWELSRTSYDDANMIVDTPLSANTWYHAIMWMKGDGTDYGCYLNGSNMSVSQTWTPASGTDTPRQVTYDTTIGNAWGPLSGDGWGMPFVGQMVYVGHYTRKLTGAEMSGLYSNVTSGGVNVPEPVSISQHVLALGNVY